VGSIKRFVSGHPLFVSCYALSLFVFCSLTIFSKNWDYVVYLANAQHLFGQTDFFEWMRPPLFPLVISVFNLFGVAGRLLFVVLETTGLFWLSFKVSKKLDLDPGIFTLFLCQPAFLIFSVTEGTELPSLIFLMGFVYFFLKNDPLSGFFLGLGTITRYSFFYLIPLTLLLPGIRRKTKAFFFSCLPLGAWMLINKAYTGNLLTSIADNYALNKIFRGEYIDGPVPYAFILLIFGYCAALSAAYFYLMFRRKKLTFFGKGRINKDILFILIIVLTFIPFLTMPLKVVRYLYLILLPLAYFSTRLLEELKVPALRKGLLGLSFVHLAALFIVSICLIFGLFPGEEYGISSDELARDSVDVLKSLNLNKGQVMSNAWPFLNHYGIPSVPPPGTGDLDYRIFDGQVLALVKGHYLAETGFENGMNNASDYPVIYEDDTLLVIGFVSLQESNMSRSATYLEQLSERLQIQQNYALDIEPCTILFGESFIGDSCMAVNRLVPLGKTIAKPSDAVQKNPMDGSSNERYEQLLGDPDLFSQSDLRIAHDTEEMGAISPENGSDYFGIASSYWDRIGIPERGKINLLLSQDIDPYPPFSISYYSSRPKMAVDYCSLERDVCSEGIQPLAYDLNGKWYLPDREGVYLYHVSEEDVLQREHLRISSHFVRVRDPEGVMVVPLE